MIGVTSQLAGLPYFMLSSTSPLLQAWFARERIEGPPYRLFALSNLGSMVALLTYPGLVEPNLSLREQSLAWSGGYAAFATACALISWRAGRASSRIACAEWPHSTPRMRAWLTWIVLAFCPSALLLAITTHLTQNVAPIPLLWVLPLALYLLSFILCFEGTRWYRRALWMPLFGLALAAMTGALLDNGRLLGLAAMIPLFCVGLFAVAMVCHGELAARKPDASALTQFYLMIAFGGMLGGLFVGYEIDPNVIELAWREFSYLADSAAKIAVNVGDAWLGPSTDGRVADLAVIYRTYAVNTGGTDHGVCQRGRENEIGITVELSRCLSPIDPPRTGGLPRVVRGDVAPVTAKTMPEALCPRLREPGQGLLDDYRTHSRTSESRPGAARLRSFGSLLTHQSWTPSIKVKRAESVASPAQRCFNGVQSSTGQSMPMSFCRYVCDAIGVAPARYTDYINSLA
jgi:hypothetical protein